MDEWCRQDRESMLFNPEDVLMASGMEPGSVAAFLHENYLNFVHEDSVEDAAAACSYFSDAGPLTACLATPPAMSPLCIFGHSAKSKMQFALCR